MVSISPIPTEATSALNIGQPASDFIESDIYVSIMDPFEKQLNITKNI